MRETAAVWRNHHHTRLTKAGTFRLAFPHFWGWQTPVEGGCLRLEQSDRKTHDVSGTVPVQIPSAGVTPITNCSLKSKVITVHLKSKMRRWHLTCSTWPSEVMFNRLVSSSYPKERHSYLVVILIYVCLKWTLFLTFETAYIAHGGSMWSRRGPQSQDDKPESRHSAWRFKKKGQDSAKGTLAEPQGAKVAILTNSWHHTHRLPASVLIFLWQTWHLPKPLSVRIQSWAATWDARRVRRRWEGVFSAAQGVTDLHSVSDLHSFQLTKRLIHRAVFFFKKNKVRKGIIWWDHIASSSFTLRHADTFTTLKMLRKCELWAVE